LALPLDDPLEIQRVLKARIHPPPSKDPEDR
jgi:hypothetical protein